MYVKISLTVINMFENYETLKKLNSEKILPVIRLKNGENVFETIKALLKGGISCAEISFSMPYAHTLLEKATKEFKDSFTLGAGTVIDSETCRLAILSGAKFIVSPTFNEDVIKTANRYSVPVISGIDGIKDIPKALSLGVEIFKLFPASNFDLSFIKDLKAPFKNIGVIPMGGINSKNAKSWIEAGAFAVGISSELMNLADSGEFIKLEKKAKELLEIIKG